MKRKQQLTGHQSAPVSYHIKELRNRFFWVLMIFLAGGIIGYTYQVSIINFLNHYIQGNLYYTSPAGNFNFIMKMSLLTGALMAIPIAIYQVIKFTQPALKTHHQYKKTWTVALMSLLLALLGMAFAMWVIVPLSLHFFAGFNVNGIEPLISADEYLNFVMKALLWFGVLFQIPLIMLFINRVKPLKPSKLIKYEKYVIVAALVIALPFTYDPVTLLIVAIPVVVLYNITIVMIKFSNRPRARRESVQKAAEQTYYANKPKVYMPNLAPVIHTAPVNLANIKPKQQSQPASSPMVKAPTTRRSNQSRVISDFGFVPKVTVIKPTKASLAAKGPSQQKNNYRQPGGLSMDMVLPT